MDLARLERLTKEMGPGETGARGQLGKGRTCEGRAGSVETLARFALCYVMSYSSLFLRKLPKNLLLNNICRAWALVKGGLILYVHVSKS